MPNNKYRPDREKGAYEAAPGTLNTAGNNAGANDELFSFHPAVVNVLMGDGSVRSVRDAIWLPILRALVSRAGGEAIPSDGF
jgi:prepilin-type processing-associated H-X9-DG protein